MHSINLADIFVSLGHRHHNRTALMSGRRQLTFGNLAASASQVAHRLALEGLAPGQNVGIALRDGMDVVVYLVALWMIDAVGVVLDFRSPALERAALAEEFDLVMIVTDNAPPGTPYPVISIGGQWHEEVARQSMSPPVSAGKNSGLALISLTSGTTGRPLGLLVRHEDTLMRIAQSAFRNIATQATHLVAQPLHFSAARNNTIQRLVQGWTVVIHPPLYSAEELAQEIIRIAPDTTLLVPSVIAGLLDYARERQTPLFPSLKLLTAGGAASLPQQKLDALKLLSPNYLEAYASSLCSNISVLMGPDILARPETVGRVAEMVRLEIVDEADRSLPVGTPGMIRVRTPSMVSGTYKSRTRPHGDRLKDGWVYPGDLGSLDEEGFLTLVGRASDVIIRGGANVHPSEIERVIAASPGVRNVAVVAYQTARESEEIAAFVVADPTVTDEDLMITARTRLSPDKRPRRFVFVDELPVTAVGKLDRNALKAKLLE